ncbi:MAG: hypothetical protein HN842_05280, partial [Gammaproteobacteria bacterium]|nr:hypothetical protein [Gammaproteobacteria bacterium]
MRIYKPRISVSLNKVKNDSFGGGGFLRNLERGGSIDLTPFMGLGGSVHTSKSINEPAGTFSISFPDKMSEEHSDSVYGLVEPMDQIEIRIAHDHQSAELPIIMRGFVSSISRSETIGGDGKPSRKVNVVGQDYGKILQIIQIIYLNNSVIGDNIISGFKMLQKYGVDASANPPIQDFVRDVFTEIVD